MPITFTIDLEDPTEQYAPNGRYVAMTDKILNLCDELKCRATFFVVGRVAEAAPQLIQRMAAKGHEIAYHAHEHISLTEEDPVRFYAESREDKNRLEQLSGKSVIGFRAPRFSLTPESSWALDALLELGFRYSSSIMPTHVSLNGFPEAPRVPFRWPNGLIEFPLPVAEIFGVRIPYLGGIYLYAMPLPLTQRWITQASANEALWTYTHPYDFDRAEPFALMPNTPIWASLILRLSRLAAEKKIRKILALGTALPLAERMPTDKLKTYNYKG